MHKNVFLAGKSGEAEEVVGDEKNYENLLDFNYLMLWHTCARQMF